MSRMADRQPMDRVWTMASIVGFLNRGPTSAVISTMMEPDVSTVWMLPRYAAASASLTPMSRRISR